MSAAVSDPSRIFHPGLLVSITVPGRACRIHAQVLEVVNQGSIRDVADPDLQVEDVREAMRVKGVTAALILKLQDAAPAPVIVVEILESGAQRLFLTNLPVSVEPVPSEMKIEVQ